MKPIRLLKHLLLPDWFVRRVFARGDLAAIGAAIAASEKSHRGELRFVVEAAMPLTALWRDQTPRARAVDLFSTLRVWDTAENNGVLIYLLWADRDVEIVADRGIHAQVGADAWETVCRQMEAAFRAGRFEEGAVAGIEAVGTLLARHFPGDGSEPNEVSDRPVIL